MIKKILVALDPDSDTPVATGCALDIAKRHGAEVVGLAVVDTGRIEQGTRGGGIGSMYYAEKLRDALTEETRDQARALIQAFEAAADGYGVPYRALTQEGVPFQRIIEDMKYHDLLVVGRDPHFFYGRPEKETDTLVRVVRATIGPTLVVGQTNAAFRRVLIAYDGSEPAVRTMKHFVQTSPFGTDLDVELLHVHDGDQDDSDLMLRLVSEYLQAHGFNPTTSSQRGSSADEAIVEHAANTSADLVVVGADSVSRLRSMAFGSTTKKLLKESTTSLYIEH